MAEPQTEPVLIRLYAGRSPAKCRGCNADIWWYETLNGKRMPMNANAAIVKHEFDVDSGRTIMFFSAADSHWATCPARAKFERRRRELL